MTMPRPRASVAAYSVVNSIAPERKAHVLPLDTEKLYVKRVKIRKVQKDIDQVDIYTLFGFPFGDIETVYSCTDLSATIAKAKQRWSDFKFTHSIDAEVRRAEPLLRIVEEVEYIWSSRAAPLQ